MHQLTYCPPHPLYDERSKAAHASFRVAGEAPCGVRIEIDKAGCVSAHIGSLSVDENVRLDGERASEIQPLFLAAANGNESARERLAGLGGVALRELARRRAATDVRRWSIKHEYDREDERALRETLRFRSASTGPNGSAHFDLPAAHTYALVCTTAFRDVAVLLDEGHGHEDHVFAGTAHLCDLVDGAMRKAMAGDADAIEVLRTFAVHGIKQLRAKRESGRA